MITFLRSSILLFLLLNPFMLIIYLLDLVRDLDGPTFRRVLIRAGVISTLAFIAFCSLGEFLFEEILHAKFASFQVFGGIVFLLIGLRFVFMGNEAFKGLRGEAKYLAGSIAMPVMIGPGTVSASMVMGKRLGTGMGSLGILVAVFLSVFIMLFLKSMHDYVRPRSTELVERYVEVIGRVAALVIGTISLEMIFQGVTAWFSC
ncbi:MAG: MarC family protein [Chitinivibrionales bacterium]|nr:MarC family protein [Chitinivibrionales bacterium]MBD3397185.1 MarC family protein [Chitinivibrionales bacterium]